MADGFGLLIDLGIGIRIFKRHFSNYGLPLTQIKAILVTHDHTDHVKAVGHLSRDFNLPVYTSARVHDSITHNHYVSKKVPLAQQHTIERGDAPLQLGPLDITSFAIAKIFCYTLFRAIGIIRAVAIKSQAHLR